MASVKLTLWTRNWLLDDFQGIVNYVSEEGAIRFYSGTQPASPENAPGGGNVLLATRLFLDPAFAAASGGSISFSTPLVTSGTDVAGTVTWARIIDGAGAGVGAGHAIMDLDVGTSGTAILVTSTSIGPDNPIEILSGVISLGAGV